MKKKFLFLIAFLCIIVMLVLIIWIPHWQEQREEREIYMFRKRMYAINFMFLTYDDIGETTSVGIWDLDEANKYISNIIFVKSEDEASSYKEDATSIAAWPGYFAEEGVSALNNAIMLARNDGHEVVIPPNLSEPIKVSDLVTYWNDVDELFYSLENGRIVRGLILEAFRGRESGVLEMNP